MRPIHIVAFVALSAALFNGAGSSCWGADAGLDGPSLRLSDRDIPAPPAPPDPHLTIDPSVYARHIHWWSIDPLPYEVRQLALHPWRHLIGFEDSHWIAEPVPLTTRAINELHITGDPRSWMLLSLGYRLLF
jgi:hypothetical protein